MTRSWLLTTVSVAASYLVSTATAQGGGAYTLCKQQCVKELVPLQCDQGCNHNLNIYDGPVFREPPVLNDTEITLYVREVRHTDKNSSYAEFNSRAFVYGDNEFGIYGPTIVMRPGTNVTVTLINELSPYTEHHDHVMNTMGVASTVNLHTHGLHIDPVVDSVFIRVEPGEEHVYHYELLPDHAPGLHWYHAHVHGSSKLHLMNGLLGAIWVPPYESHDPLTGDLAIAKSFIMIFSHLKFTEKDDRYHQYLGLPKGSQQPKGPGTDFEDWSLTGTEFMCGGHLNYSDTVYADDVSSGDFREFHLVNGLYQPVHTMLAGEIQIFNILYGSGSQVVIDFEVRTDVDGSDGSDGSHICDMWIISTDGVYKQTPRQFAGTAMKSIPESGRLKIVAAQRLGLAVQCNTPGTYYLMSISPKASNTAGFGNGHDVQRFTQNLVTLKVQATSQTPMTMPSTVVSNAGSSYLNDLTNVVPDSHWEMSSSVYDKTPTFFEMGMGSECTVGCEGDPGLCGGEDPPECCLDLPSTEQCYYGPFRGDIGDPTEPGWKGWYPHIGKLGTIEELVFNGREGGIHPLHVHVNHFQIIAYEGSLDITPHFAIGDWRDTFPTIGGRTTVRYALHGFTGIVITHCHLLYHEDLGMMGSFYVVDEDFDIASIDNAVEHIRCPYNDHFKTEKELVTASNVGSAIGLMDKFFVYRTSLPDMRAWMSPNTTRAMSLGFQYLINTPGQSAVVDELGIYTHEAVLNTLTTVQRDLLCAQIQATEEIVVALHQLRAEAVSYTDQLIERSPSGAPNANEAYNETKDDPWVASKITEANRRIHTLSAQLSLTYISGFNNLTLTNAQVQYLTSLSEGDYSIGDFNPTGLCGSPTSFAQTQLPEVGNELFAWVVFANSSGVSYVDAPYAFDLDEPQKLMNAGMFGVEYKDALWRKNKAGIVGRLEYNTGYPNQGTCGNMRAYAIQARDDESKYEDSYVKVGAQLFLLQSQSTASQFDVGTFTDAVEKLAERSSKHVLKQAQLFRKSIDSSERSLHADYVQVWLEAQHGEGVNSTEKVDHIFDLCMGINISNEDRLINTSASFFGYDDFYGGDDAYYAQVPMSCDEVAVGSHCNLNPPEAGDAALCDTGNVLTGTIRMVCYEFNGAVSWVQVDNSFACTSATPTTLPSFAPSMTSFSPTEVPSILPVEFPTTLPTQPPTDAPSFRPVESPSVFPTHLPTDAPGFQPSVFPTHLPTEAPGFQPSVFPTHLPTEAPSFRPVESPTVLPTKSPTEAPSFRPVESPSVLPTHLPTDAPSALLSGDDGYSDDGNDDIDDNDDAAARLFGGDHNLVKPMLIALLLAFVLAFN